MREDIPKVSVCIPVFNGAAHLRKTLDSVVLQNGCCLEIIVGDDGSSDESIQIVRSYIQNYPLHSWKLLIHPMRLGMAGNWNACLEAATGDFIKVMGQDDLLYPASLQRQADLLRDQAGISLVFSGCEIMSASGKVLFKRPRKRTQGVYPGWEIAKECLVKRANLIGEPVTVMARRIDYAKIGGFSYSQRYYIDLEMWLRLLKLGDCGIIDDALCAFRIHGRAVSSASQIEDFKQFDELPGVCKVVANLSPWCRQWRYLKALAVTRVRTLLYAIYG